MKFVGAPGEPDPGPEWEVWYQDTFDRECPRQVDVAGDGLARGLAELWARHMLETVQADGQTGFSRFNLWWRAEGQSVSISGSLEGMLRVRSWLFGKRQRARAGHFAAADGRLLARVAEAHERLIRKHQTSEAILSAALAASGPTDFEERLSDLGRDPAAEKGQPQA